MRSTQEYQKEDFNTPAPYEAILSIENPFEQEVAVNQMAEYAKKWGWAPADSNACYANTLNPSGKNPAPSM